MNAGWADRIGLEWRARAGAAALHLVLFSAVLALPVELKPDVPSGRQVVLVELAPAETAVTEIVPVVPEPEPELEDEAARPPDVPATIEDPEPEAEPDASPVIEDAVVAEAPGFTAPPPRPAEEPGTDETPAGEDAPIEIDPRWEIPFDPFEEQAPSALSRVALATSCARASRATRPDFCPNYSDEDLFASLAVGRGASRYDPLADIAVARATVERAAGQQTTLARFAARQARAGPTSSGELGGTLSQVPRHPEGLPGCNPVHIGLDGPGGQVSGLTADPQLGSSDGINCR